MELASRSVVACTAKGAVGDNPRCYLLDCRSQEQLAFLGRLGSGAGFDHTAADVAA